MIVLIDNYDSFSYNVYQLIGSVEPDIKVVRNDEYTVKEIGAMRPEALIISPGPGKPSDAGICIEAIRYFVGRLPIIATLKELDKEALINIVTEPKNALTKQYKKLLELDGVELEFEPEALNSIVEKAIERNTGARGLRSIIEDIMRDIMFDIPSNPKIEKCIITKDTVEGKDGPKLVINENKTSKRIKIKKKPIEANKSETA